MVEAFPGFSTAAHSGLAILVHVFFSFGLIRIASEAKGSAMALAAIFPGNCWTGISLET